MEPRKPFFGPADFGLDQVIETDIDVWVEDKQRDAEQMDLIEEK